MSSKLKQQAPPNSYAKGGWQSTRSQSALAKQQQLAAFAANQQGITPANIQQKAQQFAKQMNQMAVGNTPSGTIFYHVNTTSNTHNASTTGTSFGTITNSTAPTTNSVWLSDTDTDFVPYKVPAAVLRATARDALRKIDLLDIPDDITIDFSFPDGSYIKIANGNFSVEDKDAKLIYKACRYREFNRYVNASDSLEEFVKYAHSLNITQSEFMALPIELFLRWLVVEAAKADGEETQQWLDELNAQASKIALPAPKPITSCKSCGKFLKKIAIDNGIYFCNALHMENFQRKLGLLGSHP